MRPVLQKYGNQITELQELNPAHDFLAFDVINMSNNMVYLDEQQCLWVCRKDVVFISVSHKICSA